MDYFEELKEIADYLVSEYRRNLLDLIHKKITGEIGEQGFADALIRLEGIARKELKVTEKV